MSDFNGSGVKDTCLEKQKLFTHRDQTEGASKNRRMPETYLRLELKVILP